MKRNIFSLRNIVDQTSPDLIFLSEIQIFSSDVSHCMTLFKGEYNCEVNSEDVHDVDIPMTKSKPCGGTMILWKRSLDKYISVFPVSTPSFLPVIFSPPGSPVSAHFSLYLPTAGRETDFLDQISQLSLSIDMIQEKYNDCLLFIRGDGNTNTNNISRAQVMSSFLSSHSLIHISINHKTYHHFMGDGNFDSNIDVIIHSTESEFEECVTKIYCKHHYPDMESHHDAIVSFVSLPVLHHQEEPANLVIAPRVTLPRHKIVWSQEGIALYQQKVSESLCQARMTWLSPLSRTSLSILLLKTNEILTKAAASTNKSIDLAIHRNPKSEKKPGQVRSSENALKVALKLVKNASNKEDLAIAQESLKNARIFHRQLVRSLQNRVYKKHDEKFFEILKSKPSSAFSAIRSARPSSQPQVPFLMVGEKKYCGDRVIDGLFDSIKSLKTLDHQKLSENPHHMSLMEDYKYIKYLCNNKTDLPPISMEKSNKILFKMKASVRDFFTLTPIHFIHA